MLKNSKPQHSIERLAYLLMMLITLYRRKKHFVISQGFRPNRAILAARILPQLHLVGMTYFNAQSGPLGQVSIGCFFQLP
jgi:hypothetical protein